MKGKVDGAALQGGGVADWKRLQGQAVDVPPGAAGLKPAGQVDPAGTSAVITETGIWQAALACPQ